MAEFKSGFIALVGRPNVGKSTLLNAVVGSKVAIVSKKPQTTRTRISGIVTKKDYQMVFVDTPGIHKEKNKLDRFMSSVVETAMGDVDAILYIIDAKYGVGEDEREMLKKLKKQSLPYVIAINKIDAVDDLIVDAMLSAFDEKEEVHLISAKNGQGVDELIVSLKRFLIPGPKFFPDDMMSDQPLPVLASEIIREKALKHLGKEIPHGVGINIESVSENENNGVTEIEAVIYCEKESHKGIIIGKGGMRLKKIASEARCDLEELFANKVYLRLWVKVKEDWRNQNSILKILGYSD